LQRKATIIGTEEKSISNEKMIKILQKRRHVYFRNVSLNIKPGEKIALVGEEDSGVKEFFDALLGENYITKGTVRQRGRIVYLDA
jgi:ABC-type polysaccharide/polyol phosphate transport system ATPase subunit